MKEWLSENFTKALGGLTALFGTLGSMVNTGAFDKLLTETQIGWLAIVTSLATAMLGGATVARGFNNSAKVKIAQAMETAINSTPPKDSQ
jgi:hypothetical protein